MSIANGFDLSEALRFGSQRKFQAKAKEPEPAEEPAPEEVLDDDATSQESKPATKSCAALAEEPDLIAAYRRDLRLLGLVGESNNGLLVCLTCTSRMLKKPLGLIARGTSSSGKSTTLGVPTKLFPNEFKYEVLGGLTDAALFNGKADDFIHKILIAGERKHAKDDAAKDAGRYLRQLFSEGRMSRSVSVKDPKTGQWVANPQTREGPIAYVESTTSKSIFEEDLNRMIEFYPDDSMSQTRNVMGAIAGKYDPDRQDIDEQAIIDRHHEFQRHLQEQGVCEVGIPYARFLASKMPAGNPKARRAIQQVLSLIEALVVLQQDRRELVNGKRIATLEDYAVARQLLVEPLSHNLGAKKQYQNAMSLKKAMSKKTFTTEDISKALSHNTEATTSLFIKGLMDAGLLERLEEGKKGKPAVYTWATGVKLDTLVLPSVDDVREHVPQTPTSRSRPEGYDAYLKTPKWHLFSRKVKAHWGHRCAICNRDGPLEVHHRSYERIGQEEMTDCIPVCEEVCHPFADAARQSVGRIP